MSRTQAVILDLDGVIVDTEPLHHRAYAVFMQRLGIPGSLTAEEYGRRFAGIPVRKNLSWILEHYALSITLEEALAEREQIYESMIADAANLVVMPGVFNALDELRSRGLKLGLASGSPRGQVDTVLGALGIVDRFCVIVAGTEVPRNKPAPDVYLSVLGKLGVGAEQSVAIEDSAVGLASAKAAGLHVIMVPNQITKSQDLSLADARVENLEQAVKLID